MTSPVLLYIQEVTLLALLSFLLLFVIILSHSQIFLKRKIQSLPREQREPKQGSSENLKRDWKQKVLIKIVFHAVQQVFRPVFKVKTGQRFIANNAIKMHMSVSRFSGFRVKPDKGRYSLTFACSHGTHESRDINSCLNTTFKF